MSGLVVVVFGFAFGSFPVQEVAEGGGGGGASGGLGGLVVAFALVASVSVSAVAAAGVGAGGGSAVVAEAFAVAGGLLVGFDLGPAGFFAYGADAEADLLLFLAHLDDFELVLVVYVELDRLAVVVDGLGDVA